MKFLLVILIIRLLVAALTKKNKNIKPNTAEMKKDIFHPAEFDIR